MSLEGLLSAIGDDGFHQEVHPLVPGPHHCAPAAYYRDLSPGEVRSLVGSMTAREALVLSMRRGLDGGPGATLDEIGRKLGVTRERVRQIEIKAATALRGLIRRYQEQSAAAAPRRPALPPPGRRGERFRRPAAATRHRT